MADRPPPVRSAVEGRRLVDRRPPLELVPTTPGLSARWHVHDYPGPYCRWHYHPEHEIHLIRRSTGTAIVGDHVGRFVPGHLVLVGSNLPHHWISDTEDGQDIVGRDVVLQLHPDWFDACQRLLPELGSVRGVFERAARGLEFTGGTAEQAAVELLAVGRTTGTRRIGHLLELLRLLEEAGEDEAHPLASPWTPALDGARASDLVDRTLTYIFSRVDGDVRLTDAAAMVGLSASGFSRSFQRASGQTFTDTVRKLRLTHACRLLEQTDLPVAVVCQQVGYRNLSNFNRQFRAEHTLTPRDYRRSTRQAR
ncbi:AraC family transcriptional regulator [Microlunatus spumicola]|uniref:AraC family transcriptional regulator n=1 Tax=Microlunatus spumicola TaxID=81499 RepID=A0ABP6X6W7_9ACTN